MIRRAAFLLVAATFAGASFAADDAQLKWVFASRGHIPKGSLAAGRDTDGKPFYACRAKLANGAELPGKIREPQIGCTIVYGGIEWTLAAYQVLHDGGDKLGRWAAASGVPKGAWEVGREADGRTVYLCRAKHGDGSTPVGRTSDATCVYGADGKEAQAVAFEVLVKP